MEEARESARMSANQSSKMGMEINEYRNKINISAEESAAYQKRLDKLMKENNALNDEVRTSQENLRLSTGQIGRLQGEFKAMAAQNEEMKHVIQDLNNKLHKSQADGSNTEAVLKQECERLNILLIQRNKELKELGVEIQEQQESIRMSSAQQTRLKEEISTYKSKFEVTTE